MTDRTSLTNMVAELRRAANSIFTAADQPVAGEISAVLVQAANEIERLRNIITGCPVCSELERNIKPADEPGAAPLPRPKFGADVTLRCSECDRPVRVKVESDNVLEIRSVHCGCERLPAKSADQWTPEQMSEFQGRQAASLCQGCFRPVSACVCASMKSNPDLPPQCNCRISKMTPDDMVGGAAGHDAWCASQRTNSAHE